MQDQINAQASSESARLEAWPFANDMQQLLGADFEPDATFLEECWTVGAAAAMENWQDRRDRRADRERQSCAFRELGSLGALHFVESGEQAVESLFADRAATIASRYDANWMQPASIGTQPPSTGTQSYATEGWTPQDWRPQDQIAHRWIPQGWTPLAAQHQSSQQTEVFPEPYETAMNLPRACRLLGVTEDSTRDQIRSAYRRMVGQSHPDRLQHATEAARCHATRQMADLNEAYRLLCTAMKQEAA